MASEGSWLVSDGQVLASAEVADGHRGRARGLIGREHVEGAFVLTPCRWVHTIGMRFPIDVAFLDSTGVVLKTMRMKPHRLGVPVWHARMIVEAEVGSFSRWGLKVGDQVELRG